MRRPPPLRPTLATALALGLAGCGGPTGAPPALPGTMYQEIRPTETDREPLWSFDPGDVVEIHDGAAGTVRVHFTRAGRHAVPADDADGDGVPDYVAVAAAAWEEALAFDAAQGFRAPLGDANLAGDNGGDGRFDVYLLDFGLSSDGAFVAEACPPPGTRCIGYAVQENDFTGYGYPNRRYASRVLASHEGFHAVQAAYDDGQGVVFSEGTAVWATEAFDPSLHDFEGFVGGYLEDPGRSLDVPPPGPVPAFAYGAGLFFRFLEERFDRAVVRALVEHTEDGHGLPGGVDDPADPEWLPELDLLLAADHGSGFGAAFADFARWNLYTADAADPSVSYAEGDRYPAVALEAATLPLRVNRLRVYHASTQYREVAPDGRATVAAELVSLPGAAGADLQDLALFLAVRGADGTIARIVDAEDAAVAVTLAEGETAVVAAIVNTAFTGDSRRPGFCLGDPDEVRACRETLSPDDSGTGGTGGADDPRPGGGGDGGGCSTTGGPAGAGLLASLAALAVRLRRRAGGRRAAPAPFPVRSREHEGPGRRRPGPRVRFPRTCDYGKRIFAAASAVSMNGAG
jgi:hypothetical protein